MRAAKAIRQSTDPAIVGEWGPTIGFPLIPVAAALLPDNEMLVWSSDQDDNYSWADYTQTAILNLTTGVVSQDTVTNTDHNMFCPGVAILANGDVMVTGGDTDNKTSIYDPVTNSWTAGPPMNIGRGYQGMTLLSNEEAFTLGGSWSGALGGKLGEVWSPTGGWRELTDVPATPMYTADPQGVYRADNHGWFIATSGGRVLQAGPSKQMNWITTSGAGCITPAGLRGTSNDAMNGNAVYYGIDKIITMGGAPAYQDSTATSAAYKVTIKPSSQDGHHQSQGHSGGFDGLPPSLCQQRGPTQRPGRHRGRPDLRRAFQRQGLDTERRVVESGHRQVQRHGPRGGTSQLPLGRHSPT